MTKSKTKETEIKLSDFLDGGILFALFCLFCVLILNLFFAFASYESYHQYSCLTLIARDFCNNKNLDLNNLDMSVHTFTCSSSDREVEIKQYNFLNDELVKCGVKK